MRVGEQQQNTAESIKPIEAASFENTETQVENKKDLGQFSQETVASIDADEANFESNRSEEIGRMDKMGVGAEKAGEIKGDFKNKFDSLSERAKAVTAETKDKIIMVAKSEEASQIADSLPFVGGAKRIVESAQGETLSGRQLSGVERVTHGAKGAIDLGLDMSGVGEIEKGAKLAYVGKKVAEGVIDNKDNIKSLGKKVIESSPENVSHVENIQTENNSFVEKKLLEREPEEIKELAGGNVGGAKFVKLLDDGAGVYKSYESFDFDESERNNRINKEKAAYLFSKHLGFDMVPPTVVREINGKTGSIQEFVEDAQLGKEVSRNDISKEEKVKLKTFDFLIQNWDRHDGNYLVKNGKITAIDHGEAFKNFKESNPHDILDDWISIDITEKPLPADLVKNIKEFSTDQEKIETLRQELETMFDEMTANAYIMRIDAFAESIGEDGTVSVEKLRDAMSLRVEIIKAMSE